MADKYLALTASPSDGDDIRWYYSKLPMAENEFAASFTRTEILEEDDYSQFVSRDSLALEASFLQREEELVYAWWKEHEECSHGRAGVVFKSQPQEEKSSVGVIVREGMFEVDLATRCCFPFDWKGKNRRVVRGHWFALKHNHCLPIREDISLQLENAYRNQVWHRTTKQPWGLFAARVDLKCSTLGLFALFKGGDDSWEACLCIDPSGGTHGVKLRRGYAEIVSRQISPLRIRIGSSFTHPYIYGDPFFDDMKICLLRAGSVPTLTIQGRTNGCFAIVCVGTLFSLDYIRGNDPPALLSAQELVDWVCHYSLENFDPGTPVPDGGFPNTFSATFRYIQRFGLYPVDMYPWAGVYTSVPYRDNLEAPDMKTYIQGFRRVESHDEAVSVLRTNQSIAAGIVASPTYEEWRSKDGDEIFQGATSEEIKAIKDFINKEASEGRRANPPLHAILLVGYNKRSGRGYYLAQNSMGPLWAHGGFLKVSCTACFELCYPIQMYRKESVVVTELGEGLMELSLDEEIDDDLLDGLANLFQVEEDEAVDMVIE